MIIHHLIKQLINPTATLIAIQKEHGEFAQFNFFGKNLIYTSKPEYFEEIFNQESKGLWSRDSLYEAKKPMFGDGLFNSKSEIWINQRRLMKPSIYQASHNRLAKYHAARSK